VIHYRKVLKNPQIHHKTNMEDKGEKRSGPISNENWLNSAHHWPALWQNKHLQENNAQ